VTIPFLFAACTITATLAAVYAVAHRLSMVGYVTNLVELIGLGLAIDYSLLVVHRFREELRRGLPVDDAVARTMATAGRAAVFSGAAVSIGLGFLLLMPVPLIRSLGVGGFLVPLVSIAAVLTLQPALLSLFGRTGTRAVLFAGLLGTEAAEGGFWARLARAIMRRPLLVLLVGGALLAAAAAPVAGLKLTPGSISSIPRSPESVRGFRLLAARVGVGAVTPIQAVVDGGRPGAVRRPPVAAAISRLADRLSRDPEVYVVARGRRPPYVAAGGRYARVVVVGRHEYGEPATRRLVDRLRDRFVPAARFPAGARVYAGGAPPQGVDFLSRAYAVFPWLVLGALALTFAILLRAFRSLLLPLKAVLLNVLTVAAVYGLLAVIFRGPVEGWIPIVLFATLFGISMDYEVFLVTRMREAWDRVPDNAYAVAHGLERTGRVVTAAAAIMVAAFSGFIAGRVPGLQQFGTGLVLAIVIDATIVRALLLPAAMAVLGRWNWWLPGRVARLARVAPSPVE
jgi:RND superfamily putative drug exporter